MNALMLTIGQIPVIVTKSRIPLNFTLKTQKRDFLL